jgi:hypothetical protein
VLPYHMLGLGLLLLGATCFNELYLPLWHGQKAVSALITRILIRVLYTYIAAVFLDNSKLAALSIWSLI